jgi:hypothetical protein
MDVFQGDGYAPGLNDMGPGFLGYGKTRDLTVAEAQELEKNRDRE